MVEKQTAENNAIVRWFTNIKKTKENYNKVKSSPYASLVFALKMRKIIVTIVIILILFFGYDMVTGMKANGFSGTLTRIISVICLGYICWRIYSTIPQAKAQIEYYKKYPHTINYCPTNVKEDVDSIFEKIKQNQLNEKPKGEETKCLEKNP